MTLQVFPGSFASSRVQYAIYVLCVLVHAGYRSLLQPPLDVLIDRPGTPPTVSSCLLSR